MGPAKPRNKRQGKRIKLDAHRQARAKLAEEIKYREEKLRLLSKSDPGAFLRALEGRPKVSTEFLALKEALANLIKSLTPKP